MVVIAHCPKCHSPQDHVQLINGRWACKSCTTKRTEIDMLQAQQDDIDKRYP